MERHNPETIGVRRTGWAALDRDPQKDTVEFLCPHCGQRDQKNARRERTLYRFTDGFMQDLQGEVTQCHSCKRYLRAVGKMPREGRSAYALVEQTQFAMSQHDR